MQRAFDGVSCISRCPLHNNADTSRHPWECHVAQQHLKRHTTFTQLFQAAWIKEQTQGMSSTHRFSLHNIGASKSDTMMLAPSVHIETPCWSQSGKIWETKAGWALLGDVLVIWRKRSEIQNICTISPCGDIPCRQVHKRGTTNVTTNDTTKRNHKRGNWPSLEGARGPVIWIDVKTCIGFGAYCRTAGCEHSCFSKYWFHLNSARQERQTTYEGRMGRQEKDAPSQIKSI